MKAEGTENGYLADLYIVAFRVFQSTNRANKHSKALLYIQFRYVHFHLSTGPIGIVHSFYICAIDVYEWIWYIYKE